MSAQHPPANAMPVAPLADAKATSFHDGKYGVRFNVPPGWSLAREDGQVSRFHLDAPIVPPGSEMRGAASLGFNPFPDSVLSGATFYYSVEKHVKDSACASEANLDKFQSDAQDIAGVTFHHGHDERGQICVEARDDVYTAYRKGSCYRFDLEVNSFCAISSGATDLTAMQVNSVRQRMTDILSSVALDWKKGAAHPVPVPSVTPKTQPEPPPPVARPAAPLRQGQ